jgi:hypothetical protein
MQQINSSKKNSLISAIIASVCIVVYLAALVSTVVRIYTSIEQRRLTAEKEFFDLADLASSAGVLGFMDETFIETIDDALALSRTLEGVIISGPNGEYAFEKERGKAVNWVNNSPRFKNRFDFSRQPLYLPLRIQGLRNVNIQAVAGAVDYALLMNILKQTLVLVLAALALAFFTLLMESLLKGRRYAAAPEFNSERAEPVKPKTPPRGLYSPRSNIGWEEYTADRLEAELRRCISARQDLAFIAIECRDSIDDSLYKRLAALTVRRFAMRDLIFERKEWGIAVICPNVKLETAFAQAENFRQDIMDKYPDICMGLSSRADRPIDTERLMFEAGEALERALYDPVSYVVAFKSDPEKYRAFINSKKSGA